MAARAALSAPAKSSACSARRASLAAGLSAPAAAGVMQHTITTRDSRIVGAPMLSWLVFMAQTTRVVQRDGLPVRVMRTARVEIVDGPERGRTVAMARPRWRIGTHASSELVIGD